MIECKSGFSFSKALSGHLTNKTQTESDLYRQGKQNSVINFNKLFYFHQIGSFAKLLRVLEREKNRSLAIVYICFNTSFSLPILK